MFTFCYDAFASCVSSHSNYQAPPSSTDAHDETGLELPVSENAFTAAYPVAKFYFIWSIKSAVLQWGDAALGPYYKSRNDGPPCVMVNGEKANNGDELLHTRESRCLLAWPSRPGQTHDCVSVSHLIMQHLVVYLE